MTKKISDDEARRLAAAFESDSDEEKKPDSEALKAEIDDLKKQLAAKKARRNHRVQQHQKLKPQNAKASVAKPVNKTPVTKTKRLSTFKKHPKLWSVTAGIVCIFVLIMGGLLYHERVTLAKNVTYSFTSGKNDDPVKLTLLTNGRWRMIRHTQITETKADTKVSGNVFQYVTGTFKKAGSVITLKSSWQGSRVLFSELEDQDDAVLQLHYEPNDVLSATLDKHWQATFDLVFKDGEPHDFTSETDHAAKFNSGDDITTGSRSVAKYSQAYFVKLKHQATDDLTAAKQSGQAYFDSKKASVAAKKAEAAKNEAANEIINRFKQIVFADYNQRNDNESMGALDQIEGVDQHFTSPKTGTNVLIEYRVYNPMGDALNIPKAYYFYNADSDNIWYSEPADDSGENTTWGDFELIGNLADD